MHQLYRYNHHYHRQYQSNLDHHLDQNPQEYYHCLKDLINIQFPLDQSNYRYHHLDQHCLQWSRYRYRSTRWNHMEKYLYHYYIHRYLNLHQYNLGLNHCHNHLDSFGIKRICITQNFNFITPIIIIIVFVLIISYAILIKVSPFTLIK